MSKFLSLLSLVWILQFNLTAQLYIGDTKIDTTTLITGLDIPWEIQWGPDDYIWTTERYGRISRIHPETGAQDVILEISDLVYQNGESGLLGMVLHPDFENDPFVYTAYTYQSSGQIVEKIIRYEYKNGFLTDEFTLLDNIPGNSTHIGCRLIILPDNTLLFTTGDAQNQPSAQDIEQLTGKTHRINLDGSIPEDNPFSGNSVYSFGHRNAQGLFLAPNGIIYSSEHGPNTDDEFNIIEAGRNYGWPNVHGFCNLPSEEEFCIENNVFEPLLAWTPTIATSDIVYYNHDAIPEWKDHVLMTSLKNKRIYDLELNESGTNVVNATQLFTNWWGRLRDILVGPKGEIYLATNGSSWANTEPFTHSIVKIQKSEFVNYSDLKAEVNKVKAFPNPATDMVKISVDSQFLGMTLQLISTDNSILFEQIIGNTLTIIPTVSFPNGIYGYRLMDQNKMHYSGKIIIHNN